MVFMGIEIERKFLVSDGTWRAVAGAGAPCRQGYLALGPPASVRVRIMGGEAKLNIKQATLAIRRAEFEYPIPLEDAEELLAKHCADRRVEKTRYYISLGAHTWEVDVFDGANAGLVLAEIELAAEEDTFARPSWLGAEVSGDPRYLNSSLAETPWTTWPERRECNGAG